MKFDPLQGLDPGLKGPAYVLLGAGVALVAIVGFMFHILAAAILFLLMSLGWFVLTKNAIREKAAEDRRLEHLRARQAAGFQAPPPEMLENGPRAGAMGDD